MSLSETDPTFLVFCNPLNILYICSYQIYIVFYVWLSVVKIFKNIPRNIEPEKMEKFRNKELWGLFSPKIENKQKMLQYEKPKNIWASAKF